MACLVLILSLLISQNYIAHSLLYIKKTKQKKSKSQVYWCFSINFLAYMKYKKIWPKKFHNSISMCEIMKWTDIEIQVETNANYMKNVMELTFVKSLLDNLSIGHEGVENIESSKVVIHQGRGVQSQHQIHQHLPYIKIAFNSVTDSQNINQKPHSFKGNYDLVVWVQSGEEVMLYLSQCFILYLPLHLMAKCFSLQVHI